jgi:hypothetical protein
MRDGDPDVTLYTIKCEKFLKLTKEKLIEYLSTFRVPPLQPKVFSQEKKNDLKKLFDSGVIPPQYKQYYVLQKIFQPIIRKISLL